MDLWIEKLVSIGMSLLLFGGIFVLCFILFGMLGFYTTALVFLGLATLGIFSSAILVIVCVIHDDFL